MTSQQPSEVGMVPVLLYKMGKQGLRGLKRLAQGHTAVGREGWRPLGQSTFRSSHPGLGLPGQEQQSLRQGIREVRRGTGDRRHAGRLYKSPSQPHCPRGAAGNPLRAPDPGGRGLAHQPALALSKEMTVGGARTHWLFFLLSGFLWLS